MTIDQKAEFFVRLYKDIEKKIEYDIRNSNHIPLPYYSVLLSGIATTKENQKELRDKIFLKMNKESSNNEEFGIWIVNSDKKKDSDSDKNPYLFNSVKDYFTNLTDFYHSNSEPKKRIHIMISDQINNRGVVNRGEKGVCEGGHMFAVYPGNTHYENILQKHRTPNNSEGIFTKWCKNNGRPSPEMYEYMNGNFLSLMQNLGRDIGLCHLMNEHPNSGKVLKQESERMKTLDEYKVLWEEMNSTQENQKSIQRPSRVNCSSANYQKTKCNKDHNKFNPENLEDIDLKIFCKILKHRQKNKDGICLSHMGSISSESVERILEPNELKKYFYGFSDSGKKLIAVINNNEQFQQYTLIPKLKDFLFHDEFEIEDIEMYYELSDLEGDDKQNLSHLIERKGYSDKHSYKNYISKNNIENKLKNFTRHETSSKNQNTEKLFPQNDQLSKIFENGTIISLNCKNMKNFDQKNRVPLTRYDTYQPTEMLFEIDKWYIYSNPKENQHRDQKIRFSFVKKSMNDVCKDFDDEKKEMFSVFFELFMVYHCKNLVRKINDGDIICLLYTSPSPRDDQTSRMPSSA